MKCKLSTCDNEVSQTGKGRPRLFCSDEHTREFWNTVNAEAKRSGTRSDDHKIRDVDERTQMGVCSQCGPVKAYRSRREDGRQRWRCSTRVRAQESIGRFARSPAGRIGKLRYTYGLTDEEARSILVRRDAGVCDLCGVTRERLYVDHCHATGVVRGVICNSCNTGLGKFSDDPARLRAAADYLEGNSL